MFADENEDNKEVAVPYAVRVVDVLDVDENVGPA